MSFFGSSPARPGAHVVASSLFALSGLFVCSSAARAEQVTVTNVSYTHSKETTSDSHYRVPPVSGSPTNWKSPVDYTNGSVHVLLEVKTKPTAKETKFQICFEATPNYACTNQSATYTKTGTYEWDTKFSEMWQPDPKNNPVDWTKGVRQVALILKDTNNGKPQGNPEYVPTDLHVEVTIVSNGSSFAPGGGGAPIAPPLDGGSNKPARPDAGIAPTTDAGNDEPPRDAGTTKPAIDAGPPRTSDASIKDAATKPPPADDDDDDGDKAGDASTSSRDGGSDKSDEDSGGCSVASSPWSGGLGFLLSLVLLAFTNRRRRA